VEQNKIGLNLRTGLTPDSKKEHHQEMQKLSNKEDKTGKSLDLNNKTVCITGTTIGYTRKEAQSQLIKKFPKITFSHIITSYVDYLIIGHGIGQTKIKAAQKHAIQIIESSLFFS
jgi:NAD-dependent DNA ligase